MASNQNFYFSRHQDLPNTPVFSIDIGIGEHKNTLKHYNMAAEAAIKTISLCNIFLGHHVLIFFGVFPKCVPQFPITILLTSHNVCRFHHFIISFFIIVITTS